MVLLCKFSHIGNSLYRQSYARVHASFNSAMMFTQKSASYIYVLVPVYILYKSFISILYYNRYHFHNYSLATYLHLRMHMPVYIDRHPNINYFSMHLHNGDLTRVYNIVLD